jgi:hypothetical protein
LVLATVQAREERSARVTDERRENNEQFREHGKRVDPSVKRAAPLTEHRAAILLAGFKTKLVAMSAKLKQNPAGVTQGWEHRLRRGEARWKEERNGDNDTRKAPTREPRSERQNGS